MLLLQPRNCLCKHEDMRTASSFSSIIISLGRFPPTGSADTLGAASGVQPEAHACAPGCCWDWPDPLLWPHLFLPDADGRIESHRSQA